MTMSTLNDYETGAGSTPAPGPAEVWRNGTATRRHKVWVAFPALAEALGRDADLTRIVEVWRCGSGGNYNPIADHFPALFEAMCRADDSGRADPYAPAPEMITAPAPGRPVDWLSIRQAIRDAMSPNYEIDSAGYDLAAVAVCDLLAPGHAGRLPADEFAARAAEQAPAPADDREPTHTVAMLDDLLRAATGGHGQSPWELYGCGDWLNLAVHFAADAVTEKATLTGSTGSAAMIARTNCAAATALADMFAHLAVAACAVEGVRRDG